MAQEPSDGAQPSEQTGGSQAVKGAEAGSAATETPVEKMKEPQFITPEIFQSVLSRRDRSDQENLKKLTDDLRKQFREELLGIKEELSKTTSPAKGEGGKGGHGENAAAILALEKELKEAKTRIEAESKARADAESRERDYKFRTKVEAALARNGCTNTLAGYLMIRDHLTYDAEADKITAKVKDKNYGEVDLDLDTFIKGEFAENIIPQLFLGKVRPGAPAGGDAGPGGSKGVIKESDVARMSPKEYAESRDKIEEAMRAGKFLAGV